MRIIVCGIAGRMGRRISALALSEKMEVVGIERADHEVVGKGNILINGEKVDVYPFPETPEGDVAIDFTTPESTTAFVKIFSNKRIPLVIGTTGLKEEQIKVIKDASTKIPIVFSPNMSAGVNVLFYLVKKAAQLLNEWEVEISEVHHRYKKDSPSGTALKLGEIVAESKAINSDTFVFRGKGVTGPRKKEEIGFQVIRGGDIVGEHTVFFLNDGERIEITHRAWNRDCFARGAIIAAKWVKDQPPGLYSMKEVLKIV